MSQAGCAEQIAAVVLAAGAASRFGSPKQNLLLPSVLQQAAQAAFTEIVVVEGAYPIDASISSGARIVSCPTWEIGPGASLNCGLATLGPHIDAAVVLLADGPSLDPRAIARVVAEWRATDASLLAATYGGKRSHPVLIARSKWSQIPPAGARELNVRLVDCRDLTQPGDVDTPADMKRLEEKRAAQSMNSCS